MSSHSLNEIESMARRAARGAGHEWGIADEAGRAVRWLCAHGLPGVEALAALLSAPACPPATLAPLAGPGPLCPLVTGAALSDMAASLAQGGARLENVARPLLLLPFLHEAARQGETGLAVAFDDATAMLSARGLACAAPDALARASAAHVTIRPGGTAAATLPAHTRAAPDPAAWATLKSFAHRTYAPASEASRLSGAGAGLSDND